MNEIGPAHDPQVAEAVRDYSPDAPLRLLYGGSIVVQLGSQLYPSVTAAVAELISNAWDADARNVWVSIPFGDDWGGRASTIEVLDDGLGMNREEAQFKYLVVGRERRVGEDTDRTPGGRLLHGRKGIGKLAAFGTGRILEVATKRAGLPPIGFRLNYDKLRALEPAQSAIVEEFEPEPLTTPAGDAVEHGTRVRLTNLQAKRRPAQERFMTSMRRRFSLDESQMRVTINGEPLRRFDMDFQFRFPPDSVPPEADVSPDGFATELVDDGTGRLREVRWWIGFLERPVRDEMLQGISVLVRGKLAQRPFKFERTGGAESQLGYEYLVGEVHADWIDEGKDDESDLIASNRDTLQLEDPRLQPFIAWGRRRLRWALVEHGRLRGIGRIARWSAEMPQLAPVLRRVSGREQQAIGHVAERLARFEGLDDSDVVEVMQRVLDVREHRATEEIAREIRALGDGSSDRTWRLADDAMAVERRVASSVIATRLALVDQLAELVDNGSGPPELSRILAAFPWLLDLSFDRARTEQLDGEPSLGEAVILVGAPAWNLGARPIVIAAFWNEQERPQTDEAWLAAVERITSPLDAMPLLVGRRELSLDLTTGRTWSEALAISRQQHEAWLDVVKSNGDG